YAYNVRSWTKSITGTLFSQTLNYQEAITGNTPCYNGNISSMSWKSGVETSQRGYRFTYDGLSRLKDALYGEGATLAANTDRFNEQVTGYDKMGNILGLKRYGQTAAGSYGMIDHLTLTYNGNRLQAVKDIATSSVYGNGTEFKDNSSQTVEYTYDKNGNLIKDLNKNISNIGYNCLNLPSQITLAGSNSIDYEYGADGTKLRTVHKTGAATLTTDYCGNAVYENGVLRMLLNEAGYVSFPDRKFHFYLKDHQGNVRVVADKDGNVEETNAYYPFGGTFTSTTGVQPYKYNGKELDTRNGLNWYDYGARHYDATIGRWHVVDPMSEKNSFMSPYVYSVNNSVNYIDPMGCDTVPDDEIWDYNLLNFRTNGMGLLAEEFIPVKIKGGVKYILREFVSGENKGNYAAIELYGKDPETGFDLYEYKYVVGENKVKDFKNGDTSPTGFQYNVVRWAADNGVNGNENVYQNMFRGYLQIVKDPMNWIPTPLDPTNLIPKSWYTISSPWNRFQMLNRGKYTIENYGTHQNALKNRSLDYQKWKQ
ncbi:RHS repeat-associated core domain-containing protein, partial [Bacteroides faecichinchillae]